MHLDNELRALRPQVGRPSVATVAGHRRALDVAIAEGRTAPRLRRRGPDGRPHWLAAVAAVLVVVVAGGAVWWATARTDEVRLDTGPAGSPTSAPTGTTTADPATTVLGAASGPGAAGGQPTATVTFAPGTALACGPGTPLGSSLPGFLQLLPDAPEAAGRSTFDADGRLVTVRETARFAVEAVWPAPERQLYASPGESDGLGRADDNISYGVSLDGFRQLVVSASSGEVTALRVLISDAVAVTDRCRYVQFTVSEQGRSIARFTYDLAGDSQPAVVDRGPLVVETREVAAAPSGAVPCGGADANGTPPNDDSAAQGPVAPTPAEALEAYLATPAAATYYQSGYVEMITADRVYTYGAPIEPGSSRWVTLVTVQPVDGGWAATHVTASGC